MRRAIEEIARKVTGRVAEGEPMRRHTSVRIGGPADVFVEPASSGEAAAVLQFCEEEGLPCTLVGSGSNLLVADEGVRGVVVRLGPRLGRVRFQGEEIWAEAGVLLPKLAKWAGDRGLSGLEWAGGIPGTVGGAVAMNAGAHGSQISTWLRRVELVDRKGGHSTQGPEALGFGYRRSALIATRSHAVVAASFRLQLDDPAAIRQRMKAFAARRRRTQPLGIPSSGSVFKNPPGDHAGRLIELAGLKGHQVGGAQVSPIHANFIVNRGGATAADVLNLIDRIRERVLAEFGVRLELEVELVGLG